MNISGVLTVNVVLLWVVNLLLFALVIGVLRRAQGQPVGPRMADALIGLHPGTAAPAFEGQSLDGRAVTLNDYSGSAVALLFFSPGCQACAELIPEYHRLAPSAKRAGVEFLLVSDLDEETTRSYVTEHRIELPVMLAERADDDMYHQYQAEMIPFFTLIGADGVVEAAGLPARDMGAWKELSDRWRLVASHAPAHAH